MEDAISINSLIQQEEEDTESGSSSGSSDLDYSLTVSESVDSNSSRPNDNCSSIADRCYSFTQIYRRPTQKTNKVHMYTHTYSSHNSAIINDQLMLNMIMLSILERFLVLLDDLLMYKSKLRSLL